jgi:hypothetical protein
MRRFYFCIAALFASFCWPISGFATQPPTGNPLSGGNVLLATAQEAPHMLLSETTFDFKEVLEGSVVSHDFIVWNTGNAVLKIEQVGPTCGCLKTDFDESIPPGGSGRITLIVDFADHEGPLERTVGVFSNDPDSDDATLSVKGTAKPLLQVRPGNTISFQGGDRPLKKTSIEIVSTGEPFHIRNMETDLKGKVDYRLETVQKGRHYRLNVTNTAKEGTYSGFVKLNTDLSGKRTITISVTGNIENEIAVQPKSIALGMLASQKPVFSKQITVVSNPRRPFKITKLSYDKKLLQVTSKPLPKNAGFSLEVRANMANIPPGPPLNTDLSIETDAAPKAISKVEVRLYNSKNQTLAAGSKGDRRSP